jgi:dTDP-4-dehydrorhamnose 3,5-epimerase
MTSAGFEVLHEPLPGVFVIRTPRFEDERGVFFKVYNSTFYDALPNPFYPAEQFTSVSTKGVLRGMHFQTGRSAHQKLISCIAGEMLDVVVDVRPESPNFNKPISLKLSNNSSISILIAKGYAHGFLSLSSSCTIQYLTSSVHSPGEDQGVLWSSLNFDWPIDKPLISPRDASHPQIGSVKYTFS